MSKSGLSAHVTKSARLTKPSRSWSASKTSFRTSVAVETKNRKSHISWKKCGSIIKSFSAYFMNVSSMPSFRIFSLAQAMSNASPTMMNSPKSMWLLLSRSNFSQKYCTLAASCASGMTSLYFLQTKRSNLGKEIPSSVASSSKGARHSRSSSSVYPNWAMLCCLLAKPNSARQAMMSSGVYHGISRAASSHAFGPSFHSALLSSSLAARPGPRLPGRPPVLPWSPPLAVELEADAAATFSPRTIAAVCSPAWRSFASTGWQSRARLQLTRQLRAKPTTAPLLRHAKEALMAGAPPV
mmetsp:Transcript_80030/g.210185  ORF Transcript_80030/g.210185 Transcript_80030/m.210185 type:complete len:297 (+) Transcript_80030:280-1170(+)